MTGGDATLDATGSYQIFGLSSRATFLHLTPQPEIFQLASPGPQPSSDMADKLRTQQQLEALQNKYVGTGHADTTKHEWTANIMRDSYASYQGHPPLLYYMSVASGKSTERTRIKFMNQMKDPVGPPPATEDS